MILNKNWQTVDSYVWIASSNKQNTVTFYLEAKIGDYNIETNKTPIYTKLRSVIKYSGNGGTDYKYTCSYAPTIQGKDVWYFGTETITETDSSINNLVEHNPDGTKSLTLTATLYNGYKGLNKTMSGDVTLPTIPRASSIAVSNGNIGSQCSINIASASSSFTHTLTYNFMGLTGTIITKTSWKTFNWNLPTEFYSKIPNAKSGNGTVYCETYNGDTKIGSTTSDTFTAYVDESTNQPTIEGQPLLETTDTHTLSLTGNNRTIIKDYSNITTNVTVMAHSSASLSEYRVVVGNQTKAQEFTNNFDKVSTNVVNVYAKDSRGYTLEGQYPYVLDNLDILNYYKPKITSINITRTEQTSQEVQASLNGNYWNDTFGAVTNVGSVMYCWRVKESSSSTWGEWSSWIAPTISANNFSITNLSLGTNYDTKKSYDFQFAIKDALGNLDWTQETKSNVQTVTVSTPVIEVYEDGTNVNGFLTLNNLPIINTYSTDEVLIGTWIDGKPLYRKTFQHTMGSILNDWELIGPLPNVKTPIKMYGVYNNIDVFYPVPAIEKGNVLTLYCDTTQKKFFIKHNYEYASNKSGTYVIEYTKTTD